MLSRRRLLSTGTGLAAAGALLPALGGCSSREAMMFAADTHPDGYPTVEALRWFGDALRRESQGRMDLRLFPGGQLGAERDTLEITIFGGLDVNRVNLAPLNAIEPLTLVPALPFLFDDDAHMRRALDGPVGTAILESLRPHGLVGLAFYDSGQRHLYTARRTVRTPSDLAGLKIRVPNSDLYVAMVAALGADPTPMDIGEVYQGLVQGVVDGAENNFPSFESGRHFEVAPRMTLTGHVIGPEVLVMSERRWGRLDAADQALIARLARDSVAVMRRLWDVRVETARARLGEAGVRFEMPDRAAFRALMEPVWDRFVTTTAQKQAVADILALSAPGAAPRG